MHGNENGHSDEIIEQITETLCMMARGQFACEYKALGSKDILLAKAISQISAHQKSIIRHVNLIAQGRYDVDFAPISDEDELGFAINDMTAILREMSYENKKSAWIKSGQAELSNIIRGDQTSFELGKNVLRFLARYVDALVGTIFQVSFVQDDTLELIGSYAISNDGQNRKKIRFGQGLVGQCAVEKEQLVFTDFPDDYLVIGSSLGQASPKHIIVTPFLIEKELVGVMELGVLYEIDQTKLELLRQVSENIAIALKSSQNSERLKELNRRSAVL